MRLDIMVDLETLGNTANSTIIQLAAVPFDLTTGEIFGNHIFNKTIDIEKTPLFVTGSTLKWWFNENPILLGTLLNSGKESEEAVLKSFIEWIDFLQNSLGFDPPTLWGNGILFDNAILRERMQYYSLKYPILYFKDRDVRTILEIASLKQDIPEKELKKNFMDPEAVAHNALDDALFQVRLVSGCFDILKEGAKNER